MESTVANYLDDDGNEVKADASVKLPKGYALLSSKKTDKGKKVAKPLKEVKKQAEALKPVAVAAKPNGELRPYTPTAFEQLRGAVANSAIGYSLQSTMPKVAEALHLQPTERMGTPEAQAHKEGQMLAPEYLAPMVTRAIKTGPLMGAEAPKEGYAPDSTSNRVEGSLRAAGGLTSIPNLEMLVAAGPVEGLVKEGLGAGTAQLISRLASGGFTVQMLKGLYDQNKAYKAAVDAGNTNEAQKIQGEMGVNAVMALLTGKHALSKHPFTPVKEAPVRDRTNIVHRNGSGEVRQANGQAPSVWLSPEGWHSLMGELYPGENAAETNGVNLPANSDLLDFATKHKPAAPSPAFSDVQNLLAKAHENASQGGVAVAKARPSIQQNVNVMREELNHTWQRSLTGKVNDHLSPEAFDSLHTNIPKGMAEHLQDNGYDDESKPEMVTEAAAKLMDGRPERFNVTPDEAVDFLDNYFREVTTKHGAKALEELKHVRGIAADAKTRVIEQHSRTGVGQDSQPVSSVAEGWQGGAEEGVPTAGAEQVAATPQKPLHEMSPDEIGDELGKAKNREKQDVIDIFGEEGAKRYNNLQRAANNSYDMQRADKAAAEIQEMESKLTPEQHSKLFGIGDTRHSEEDLREYHNAYHGLDDSSPEALGQSLKWAVSQVGDPTRSPDTMTSKERLQLAQLRWGYEDAVKNGYDPIEVIKSAINSAGKRFSDRNDAEFMLRDVIQGLHIDDGAKETPQLGAGQVSQDGLFNREKEKPTWYLKSERLLNEKMRGPMPAQDIQKMLVGGGIKPEEMHWTGLDEFLDSKGKNKVTPQEIKDHLATNNIQIKEVTKGATEIPKGQYLVFDEDDKIVGAEDTPQAAQKAAEAIGDGASWTNRDDHAGRYAIVKAGGDTKYDSYVLPGGKNYRERLLMMADNGEMEKLVAAKKEAVDQIASARAEMEGTSGSDELRKRISDASNRSAEISKRINDIKNNRFTSGHWDEPDILAHVRSNDRTGPNGEKLLHVEEVQSDMMQSMRKQRETIAQTLAGEGFYDIIKKMQDDGTIEVEC